MGSCGIKVSVFIEISVYISKISRQSGIRQAGKDPWNTLFSQFSGTELIHLYCCRLHKDLHSL